MGLLLAILLINLASDSGYVPSQMKSNAAAIAKNGEYMKTMQEDINDMKKVLSDRGVVISNMQKEIEELKGKSTGGK